MRTKVLKQIAICMFVVLTAGFISPAADAQETNNQNPILLVKIRNIERFLNDIETLMPQTSKQFSSVRTMLQGTHWIDAERSITAGMVLEGTKTNWILLIPFRTANANFQMILNATARKDYYVATFPPQPNSAISPAIEESLLQASITPVIGSITLEASTGRLLHMIEPQLDAALKQMEAFQSAPTNQSGLPQLETRAIFSDMLNFFKQMETLRLGMDLSDNILTLQYDIDALPDTLLARILTDPHSDTRLMNYLSDMPIQFRSRAPGMSDMMELANLVYGRLYGQLGINFDQMSELTKAFTGEIAGGMKMDATGIAMEAIYVLQPGINGEDFLYNTYLPWFERYGQQLSGLLAKQPGGLQSSLYERTPDSLVDGLKVIGMKQNLNAILATTGQNPAIFDKLAFEMRLASAGDLMFIASDDVKMANLIRTAHSLIKTPAQGPTTQVDIKLGALLKGIQSIMPTGGTSMVWPSDLGNMTMKTEMWDGKLTSRTRINIDEIRKLVSAVKAQTLKK